MANLFSPLKLRDLTLRNRIMMSPMCMYSAETDGIVTPWHITHYASRAAGGTGLIVLEATSVEARGRISTGDLGLWDDAQVTMMAKLAEQVHAEGAAIGVQLAHAGRKAWSAERGVGPEIAVGPTSEPFGSDWLSPHALTETELESVIQHWQDAALRAHKAGIDVIEIHGAHGYLVHEFLSPITNQRDDDYGGDLKQRMTLLLRIADSIREVWPAEKPLLVRLSATDWLPDGLTVEDTVAIASELKQHGVDLIDCSTGGIAPESRPYNFGPGYQVPFAAQVRRESGIATGSVGLITQPEFADALVRNGDADLVILGRELLRDPYWALRAAKSLGHEVPVPRQYQRGW